jgi:hypothetical protein
MVALAFDDAFSVESDLYEWFDETLKDPLDEPDPPAETAKATMRAMSLSFGLGL